MMLTKIMEQSTLFHCISLVECLGPGPAIHFERTDKLLVENNAQDLTDCECLQPTHEEGTERKPLFVHTCASEEGLYLKESTSALNYMHGRPFVEK